MERDRCVMRFITVIGTTNSPCEAYIFSPVQENCARTAENGFFGEEWSAPSLKLRCDNLRSTTAERAKLEARELNPCPRRYQQTLHVYPVDF